MINVLADENMPYVTELFGDFSNITFKAGREIVADDLIDVDVLLVRSITKVNSELIANANKLRFVGSATIGLDHIDGTCLDERGIIWTNAPGCNAIGVAQYVLSSLLILASRKGFELQDKRVAIVGAGNIGKQLAKILTALSIEHFFCDPPLKDAGAAGDYREMDEVMKADIISLHVPMTKDGDYPTYHLFDEQRLGQLSDNTILLNSCRGDVIDNEALDKLLANGKELITVMDVWQNEPQINQSLLNKVDIASSHIAGYSFEGKARGTYMLYQRWCELNNKVPEKSLVSLLPKANLSDIKLQQALTIDDIKQLVTLVYDVRDDDELVRAHGLSAKGFDNLRKQYKVRREFSAITVHAANETDAATLRGLGFNMI
ncbi:MAG: 4-phosphoerythronate dehydrogenase [Psychrobium sp.]